MNPYTALTLAALEDSTALAAENWPVIQQNLEAAGASADDVARALDERSGHREFSLFTPPEGRA